MELWQAALGILIASALASCIHEAGHVLVARVLGGRLRAVGIGLPWRALHFTVGGVAVFAGARPYAGACVLVEPPPTRWSRTHTALVLAAGPLATLFSSALIAIDPSPAARICAFVFLVHGVANLLPIGGRGSGLSSDGAAIIALQTGADAGAIAARTMRHQAAALRRLGFATTSREVWREARLDRRLTGPSTDGSGMQEGWRWLRPVLRAIAGGDAHGQCCNDTPDCARHRHRRAVVWLRERGAPSQASGTEGRKRTARARPRRALP